MQAGTSHASRRTVRPQVGELGLPRTGQGYLSLPVHPGAQWQRMSEHPRGAYGLRLGPPLSEELLVEVPESWPQWQLSWQYEPPAPPAPQHLSAQDAQFNVQPSGRVVIERVAQRSTLYSPKRPTPCSWAHPYLASTAAISAHWRGWACFHAGAFIVGDGAWALLAGREGGKSSLLAWLALRGHQVVCDDVLVVDGQHGLAGPRCVDLRENASKYLKVGRNIGQAGTRERWRVQVGPVPPATPLRGWVALAWGQQVTVEALKAAERYSLLARNRAVLTSQESGDWLGLLALPMLRFCRPQAWSGLDDAMRELLGAIERLSVVPDLGAATFGGH